MHCGTDLDMSGLIGFDRRAAASAKLLKLQAEVKKSRSDAANPSPLLDAYPRAV